MTRDQAVSMLVLNLMDGENLDTVLAVGSHLLVAAYIDLYELTLPPEKERQFYRELYTFCDTYFNVSPSHV